MSLSDPIGLRGLNEALCDGCAGGEKGSLTLVERTPQKQSVVYQEKDAFLMGPVGTCLIFVVSAAEWWKG